MDFISLRRHFTYAVYPASPQSENCFYLARNSHYAMTLSTRSGHNGFSWKVFMWLHTSASFRERWVGAYVTPPRDWADIDYTERGKMKILVDLTTKQDHPCLILEISWSDTSTQSTNLSTWHVILLIGGQYGNWGHKGATGQSFLWRSLTGGIDS